MQGFLLTALWQSGGRLQQAPFVPRHPPLLPAWDSRDEHRPQQGEPA